jgi:ribosome maturation factor RimP
MADLKSQDTVVERVGKLVEEALSESALYLVDLVVRGRTGSRVVEVYVDGDAGVGVDELAEMSRRIAFLLDTEDPIKGKYNLNVSSPGTDRALLFPRQYAKHRGKSLEIHVRSDKPESEGVTETGELIDLGEEAVELRTKSGEHRTISFDRVERARIVLPW